MAPAGNGERTEKAKEAQNDKQDEQGERDKCNTSKEPAAATQGLALKLRLERWGGCFHGD